MNAPRILLALAFAALLAPLASASTGPFQGHVRQGQTDVHTFDNNPQNLPCPQVMTTYTVTLTYTPTSDVLTLTVGSLSATGSNGFAQLTFERNVCTSFDILVTGTSVARRAAYEVTVTEGGATI